MIVSDTSPISYLTQIETPEILRDLFQQVVIPGAVHEELMHPRSPAAGWLRIAPEWLIVRESPVSVPTMELGRGEAEAIELAVDLKADRLLIDDLAGRRAAQTRRLKPMGTLAILVEAASQDLLDLRASFDRLLRTNFHVSRKLVEQLLVEFERRSREKPE